MPIIDDWILALCVSTWVWLPALLVVVFLTVRLRSASRWKAQDVTFAVGGFKVRLTPDDEVARIAHQAWTELVTRKAGILVEDDDVIVEVYDSWYQMFGAFRRLAQEVPVAALHDSADAKELLDALVKTMNNRLRSHLTKHHARFRDWWQITSEANPGVSPQERQRTYPQYEDLMSDMREVNGELMDLAETLRKLAHEREVESLHIRLVRQIYPRYKR